MNYANTANTGEFTVIKAGENLPYKSNVNIRIMLMIQIFAPSSFWVHLGSEGDSNSTEKRMERAFVDHTCSLVITTPF